VGSSPQNFIFFVENVAFEGVNTRNLLLLSCSDAPGDWIEQQCYNCKVMGSIPLGLQGLVPSRSQRTSF